MARTTIDIDEALLRELKKRAAAEGRTLQAVVNEYLKRAAVGPARSPYRLTLEGWRATSAVDLLDRDALLDVMDRR